MKVGIDRYIFIVMRVFFFILLIPSLVWAQRLPSISARVDRAGFGVFVGGDLTGSGIVIDPTGLALTAAHQIVQQDEALHARSIHLGASPLTVLAVDLGHDLALIQLGKRTAPYDYVPLAQQIPGLGEPIYLLGSPIYRHNLLLRGSIARAQAGYEYFPSRRHYVRVGYVSGPSPAGTSGGAWLSADGHLVGIQIGLMHTGTPNGSAPVGIAYMAPLDGIRALVKRRRSIQRPSLMIGVEELWEQDADARRAFQPQSTGLYVAKMSADSPAAIAGLAVGDLIISMGDQPVIYRDSFLNSIRSKQAEETIRLTVMGQNRKTRRLSISLSPL